MAPPFSPRATRTYPPASTATACTSMSDPRTARFRVNSPKICASCHTDAARMTKYGLSTAVLRTYVADFHGSTVTLFQKQHPDQATNKPVCFDCHGVHDIPHTRDPQKGIRTKANLLRTCQKCHTAATADFPDAWMSHYIPDPQRTPLVYWARALYLVLIPATIGGMLLFVATDFARRRIDRRRAARGEEGVSEERVFTALRLRPAGAARPPDHGLHRPGRDRPLPDLRGQPPSESGSSDGWAGIEGVRVGHRAAAVILMVTGIWHLLAGAHHIFVLRRPLAILPRAVGRGDFWQTAPLQPRSRRRAARAWAASPSRRRSSTGRCSGAR